MDLIRKHAKLISITSIIFLVFLYDFQKKSKNYAYQLRKINDKFIREVEKEYSLYCSGSGGSFAGSIKKISLTFYCFEEKTIEEARDLEVKCVERLNQLINSSDKIRPFLYEVPFPSQKVQIMISFCDKDFKSFSADKSISLILNCKGNLYYTEVYNDDRPNETVLEEPYSEAYKIVTGHELEN